MLVSPGAPIPGAQAPGAPAPSQGSPFAPPASLYGRPPPASPYGPPPRRSLEPHFKVVAIFNIILGVMTFGWAFIWLAELVLFATGQIEPETADEFSNLFAIVFVVVLLFLSLAAGVIHMLAGVRMLGPKPGARVVAIIAGIAGICSIWTCCLWPLGLGAGIYTLAIVLRTEAQDLLK